MNTIQTDIRTIFIAQTLLYRYGGNKIDIQRVDYDLFHLLVTLNVDIPTVRCGVVVMDVGGENTPAYQQYVNMLKSWPFKEDDPDNMPILILIVDPRNENGYITFQLGINNRFEPIVYSLKNLQQLTESNWSSISSVVQSMNRTITILSSSAICVLRQVEISSVQRNRSCGGVIMYARRNTQAFHIQRIRFEDELSNYIYDAPFQKDDLDNLIEISLKNSLCPPFEFRHQYEKLLVVSEEVRELSLYSKQYGFKNLPFQIRLFPDTSNIEQAVRVFGIKNNINTPIINNVMIYAHGDISLLTNHIFYTYNINANIWFSECNKFIELKDSLVPIDNWINLQ